MNRADLRTKIRQRADMVNSQFVSDAELNGLIDTSTEDLHDFMISKFGDKHFARVAWLNVRPDWAEAAGEVTDPTIAWPNNVQAYNLVPGSEDEIIMSSPVATPGNGIAGGYVLPFDFARLVRIHFTVGYVTQVTATEIVPPPTSRNPSTWRLVTTGDGQFYPMRPMDLSGQVLDTKKRSWLANEPTYHLVHGPHYFITGTALDCDPSWINSTIVQFLPLPDARCAVQVFYVPKPKLLADDASHFAYDFTDYLIFDCAAECLEKQESDARPMRARLEQVKNRIQNNARTVDVANPKMVSMSTSYHSQVGQNRRRGPPWS
jgi:hypothetical protein